MISPPPKLANAGSTYLTRLYASTYSLSGGSIIPPPPSPATYQSSQTIYKTKTLHVHPALAHAHCRQSLWTTELLQDNDCGGAPAGGVRVCGVSFKLVVIFDFPCIVRPRADKETLRRYIVSRDRVHIRFFFLTRVSLSL